MSPTDTRLARALARRTEDLGAPPPPVRGPSEPPPAAMLEEIRRRLLAGETHYTTRPGTIELRRLIAARIEASGGPRYDPGNEVVVTAGRGEAMLAALLALRSASSEGATDGHVSQARVAVIGDSAPYWRLFAALGIEPVRPAAGGSEEESEPVIHIQEQSDIQEQTDGETSSDADRGPGVGALCESGEVFGGATITIGDLDDLPHLAPFRIGYAAGPAVLIKPVMAWKQAFSICTAAPSQRAATWALEQAEEGP